MNFPTITKIIKIARFTTTTLAPKGKFVKTKNVIKNDNNDIRAEDTITFLNFLYTCIDDKYTRPDTLHMFEEYSGIKSSVILELIKSVGKHAVYPIIETVIDGMRQ